MTLEIITDPLRLTALHDEWTELQGRSASGGLFLTWDWLNTWWKHLSGGRRLLTLVARHENRVTAIAPFAIRPAIVSRLIPFRAVELLGNGSVGSDYLDLIVEKGSEPGAIREIAGQLAALRLPLELSQIRLDRSSASALIDSLGSRGWRAATSRTNVCPFIRLAGLDWSSYLASLGGAHRANLHRRIRNLQKIGDVRFDPVCSEDERHQALARLISLHNDRWRERGGSDAFHTRDMILFHHDFSAAALRNGWLRLNVLRVGATPVAYFYGFRHGAVHYFYQSAFDPAWSGHSVGLVAMGLAIRSAIEEGAGEFDMLHGAERYKYLWAHEEREIGRTELHPPLLRGHITSGAAELGRAARSLGRSLMRAPGGGPLA